jgi:hypothetical protein
MGLLYHNYLRYDYRTVKDFFMKIMAAEQSPVVLVRK